MRSNFIFLNEWNTGGTHLFAAHLLNILNHKVVLKPKETSNRIEKKPRYFGWGVNYYNTPFEMLRFIDDIVILVLGWDSHWIAPFIKKISHSKNIKYFVHHPADLKDEVVKDLVNNGRLELITIRPALRDFIKDKFNKDSIYFPHPYFPLNIANNNTLKEGAVTISRIDPRGKGLDIVYEVNKKIDFSKRVLMYGSYQGADIFRTFKTKEKIKDFEQYLMGKFPNEFNAIDNVLKFKKFVIDLTRINNDGGGTQYTFLDAIRNNCCLILHKDWINTVKPEYRVFEDGYNCLTVGNKDELIDLLNKQDKIETDDIVKNSYKILDDLIKNNINWINLFQ